MPPKKRSDAKADPKTEPGTDPTTEPVAVAGEAGPEPPDARYHFYDAGALVEALAEAAELVQRVGDLPGHASTACRVLRRLHRLGGRVDPADAQELRDGWERAALRARVAFDATRGELRVIERGQSILARVEVLRAFDALNALTAYDGERG
jgi:hypothetical protein